MKKPHWFSSNFFSKNLNFVVTFFAPPALTPRRLDLQKFAFNLFCRKEQELSGEYFRFFIALKMKELHWFSCNFFFFQKSNYLILLYEPFLTAWKMSRFKIHNGTGAGQSEKFDKFRPIHCKSVILFLEHHKKILKTLIFHDN